MLRSIKKLIGFTVQATDGEIGRVKDIYFDDHSWTIRYHLLDTGKWLPGRQVLISPESVEQPDWEAKRLPVKMTRKKIETSPGIEEDEPVSRKKETELRAYFGWPIYWAGFMPSSAIAYSPGLPLAYSISDRRSAPKGTVAEEDYSHDLRSAHNVIGYHIEANDGEIGHVEDFLVEDSTWVIRYLVVDTKNWWPGGHVLVSPHWVEHVIWEDAKVRVDLTKGEIRKSPPFNPSQPVERDYETRLHDHYRAKKYWMQ